MKLFINNFKNRVKYKKELKVSPIKIYKDKNGKYIIESINNGTILYEEYKEPSDFIINNLSKSGKISRILEFEHLKSDINNKCITMSHPYLFEDGLENQYSINEKIYISCFSYSTGNENSYAWWNIYGKSKTKFRMTIDIKDFIKSIISLLEYNRVKIKNNKRRKEYIENNIEIYLGSLNYKYIDKIKNENESDFFDKKNDFKFENELRLMVKINNEIKNTDYNPIKTYNIKGLPVLCSFPIKKLDIYKNMSTNKDDIIFHPYDKTLLDKDKEAMLNILNQLKNNI